MPQNLNNFAILSWGSGIMQVTREYTYGHYSAGRKRCNCWDAVMIGGLRARIFTSNMVRIAGRLNRNRDNALASYVFAYRSSIMFASSARNMHGIPGSAVEPGSIVVWGKGAHVAFALGDGDAIEFDRNNQGFTTLNAIDTRYRSFPVMCAPPPTQDELQQFKTTDQGWDVSAFSDTQKMWLAG